MTIELRPLTEDDLPAVCALHNRSEAHDGVPRVLELEELAEELEGIDLALDGRLALVDGELAGYAYTYHLPSDTGQERCYVFGQTDPSFRRRGVGAALMRFGVERGTEQLRSSGNGLPKYLRADSSDDIAGALRLFESCGMQPVRWFEELLRPLVDLPPLQPVDGARIVPWPDGREGETLAVKNAAFADHWGSTPTRAERWQQQVRGFGARPDLSFVAEDERTGEIVACCLNHRYEADDVVLGRRDGWIDTLGTMAAWRGRGLASGLIAASLRAFADAGLTHASIGVDADSPTGASRLYRSLGFSPVRRSVTYQLDVTGR